MVAIAVFGKFDKETFRLHKTLFTLFCHEFGSVVSHVFYLEFFGPKMLLVLHFSLLATMPCRSLSKHPFLSLRVASFDFLKYNFMVVSQQAQKLSKSRQNL